MRPLQKVFRVRLAALIAVLGLAVAACVLTAAVIARNTSGTIERLAGIEVEAARMAREFRGAVDDLHGVLLRLGTEPVEDGRATIAAREEQLQRWLAERLAAAHSAEERRVLEQLRSELQAYFRRIEALGGRPEGWLAPLDAPTLVGFDDTANRLQSLADDFAKVHNTGLREVLTSALDGLVSLRNLVFTCLALLVLATGAVALMLYRDVVRPLRSQLIESETLLAHREKLAALGTLAAGVAHEIRNPLTAIKARLYALRRSLAVAAANEDLQAIASEIERLERVVREVLQYARPAAPTLDRIDVAAWLRELAAFLEPDLTRSAITLQVEAEDGLELRADPGQLRQIIINLVRNAQEAFDGRPGRITLAGRRERAAAHGRSGEMVTLSVIDDGPGIPADVQPRLFDPFFTTKKTGTGLGLSIVAKLVEGHGGDIVLQTAARAGTCFSVRLPAAGAPDSFRREPAGGAASPTRHPLQL